MQTSRRWTVEHNSGTRTSLDGRTPVRYTEDTINLDTGRIKSRIYSPDTERDGTVLSPTLSCLSLSHGVGWLISDGHVQQYLFPRNRSYGPANLSGTRTPFYFANRPTTCTYIYIYIYLCVKMHTSKCLCICVTFAILT